MKNVVNYEVNEKEKLYFGIKIVVAVIGYGILFYLLQTLLTDANSKTFIPLLIYVLFFLIYIYFKLGLLIGYIKGNAIKVTKSQFPDIYNILLSQCATLEIKNVPDLYIMQSGGILNAFATTFWGANYIVLYSEIAEEAYQNNMKTVEFVIGHELGHIKRKHLLKTLLLFPSFVVPFLNSAYSRACEYTCDSIGASLCPSGAKSGLILLASGKNIWTKVNIEKFIEQESSESGFWFWFAEKTSSHPRLTKRIIQFNQVTKSVPVPIPIALNEYAKQNNIEETDHNRYLPK